jgi:C4-dicarboxylate transporter DctQ subunit
MKKIGDIICLVQRKITASLMLLIIIVIAIQIIARMIFNLSTPWTEELGRYLLIWIAFTGSVGLMIKGEHLSIDVLSLHFGPKLKKWARIFNAIVFVALSGFLFIYGLQLCSSPVIINGRTPAMQLRKVYVYIILPVSMGITTLYSFAALLRAVWDLFRGGKTPERQEVLP